MDSEQMQCYVIPLAVGTSDPMKLVMRVQADT